MTSYQIEIKIVPSVRVASLQATGLPFHKTVPEAFTRLVQWMVNKGLPMPTGSPMGFAIYYDDPKATPPDKVRFKVAVPVPSDIKTPEDEEAAVEELPGYQVAFLTVLGPYTNLEDAYSQLYSWVFQQGYQPADAPREVYVKWGEEIPPSEWVTEIQAPIKS